MMYNKNRINRLKDTYPEGTRVELISMDDPYSKLQTGEKGTVMCVDDMGTVHINWDSGSTLGLVPGEDSFKTIHEPKQDTGIQMGGM